MIPTPALLAVCLLSLPLDAQRRRPERPAPPALEHGTFAAKQLESVALDRKLGYGIYLPDGYDDEANAETRYPLVVWLHGMFEDHMRFHVRGGTAIVDEMIGEGDLPELILVTANGDRRSFYVNGEDSGAWEDAIVEDLLGHVERTYRVAERRHQRALMGVSMGGYGALKIALKHPQLFGIVAAHSAALMPRDPKELDERFPWLRRWGGGQRALGKIFGDPLDLEKWREENVLAAVDEIDARELSGLKIYFDCGDGDRYGFDGPNRELHELLESKKVPHTWRLVEGGNHGWRTGYNQSALPHSLAFVAAAIAAGRGTSGLEGLLGPGRRDG